MYPVFNVLTRPDGQPVFDGVRLVVVPSSSLIAADQSEVTGTGTVKTDPATGLYRFDNLPPQSELNPPDGHYVVTHPGGETVAFQIPDGAPVTTIPGTGELGWWLWDITGQTPDTPSPIQVGVTAGQLQAALANINGGTL